MFKFAVMFELLLIAFAVVNFRILCVADATIEDLIYKDEYRTRIDKWLNEIDADFHEFNSLSAQITWGLATGSDGDLLKQGLRLGVARNQWKNNICNTNIRKDLLDAVQRRKIYLFCRGAVFDEILSKEYSNVMNSLSHAYLDPVCLKDIEESFATEDVKKLFTIKDVEGCLYGEPDLEMLMKRQDLNAEQLELIWTLWHNWVGPRVKNEYSELINVQNKAARSNGYKDIGEVWRDELEMSNLEKVTFELYDDIQPVYEMLHAVVRHFLFIKYGPEKIDRHGLLPIHLLGNMWGQDWSPLISLFNFDNATVDLNANLKKKKWSVRDMVLQAEDMYTSLGLPKMTNKFWKYSIFEKNDSQAVCHGTAGNLFQPHDFRMLLCADVNMEDFYVIHHEMGHIEYYMAYENMSTFFQDGANTAFHESIGDAIMHAVMTPHHLYRLGLISDSQFRDKNTDLYLLLTQLLYRLPEMPFALMVDKYRWDLFSDKIPHAELNQAFWQLNKNLRGVAPPTKRGEEYFDAGAKFHVPDNTPYIRYFLSSILQMEMFQGLCELTLFGSYINQPTDSYVSKDLPLPLHRCDIYGSKKAGSKLKSMMKKGSSQHWSKSLEILTGKTAITTQPFLEYYKPIIEWMKQFIDDNNIPVGW